MQRPFSVSAFLLPPPLLRSSSRRATLPVRPPRALASSSSSSSSSHAKADVAVSTTSASSSSSSRHADSSRIVRVATTRALTPMRRPREQTNTTEEQTLPSARRTDLMAPKSSGPWSLLPYMAASAVILSSVWLLNKRFVARQTRLIEDFGEVVVFYGNTPDAIREIVAEYKRKLGPGIKRPALFSSYLRALVSEKPITPNTMQEVAIVKRLLKLSDKRAVSAINLLGNDLQDSPSLLGKLLFLADRMLEPDVLPTLKLVDLFPYSPPTVADLQRNMLERCYKDFLSHEMDAAPLEEPPMAAANALRIAPDDAQAMFDAVQVARQRKREADAAAVAAAAAEQATKPDVSELDYPARSGEPAKAAVHAYQCSDCGYTLFPAAGREFKFYGDDFVCPACGAPKDKFVDLNSDDQ